VTNAALLISGYSSIRPLEQSERDALPVLAQGAAIRFLLTRLHDWLNHPPGAMVTPKDPLDYLKRLRFHLGAKTTAAYGF
jgi:homoserine kinase type II